METIALTEAVYYILLSLDQPLHGYGIMQNAEALSHLFARNLPRSGRRRPFQFRQM